MCANAQPTCCVTSRQYIILTTLFAPFLSCVEESEEEAPPPKKAAPAKATPAKKAAPAAKATPAEESDDEDDDGTKHSLYSTAIMFK